MKTRLAAVSRRSGGPAAPRSTLILNSALRSRHSHIRRLVIASLALELMAACSSSGPKVSSPGMAYESAKEFFAKGHSANYDHALDTLATLSTADPPNDYTDRARVLRAVIISGQFEGYKRLAEAYQKGADKATESAVKSEYTGLYRDTLRRAGEISLTFAETAMQLTRRGQVPKGLTLDAPYPVSLASISTVTLDKIEQGGKTEETEQSDAALGAPGMGIAKMLAAVVGGDAEAVKSKLNAGPIPLDSAKFALFLATEVSSGASVFDKKHIHDPGKYKQLLGIAQNVGQASEAALKETPNPDVEKDLKKLQNQLKAGLKALQAPAD